MLADFFSWPITHQPSNREWEFFEDLTVLVNHNLSPAKVVQSINRHLHRSGPVVHCTANHHDVVRIVANRGGKGASFKTEARDPTQTNPAGLFVSLDDAEARHL